MVKYRIFCALLFVMISFAAYTQEKFTLSGEVTMFNQLEEKISGAMLEIGSSKKSRLNFRCNVA